MARLGMFTGRIYEEFDPTPEECCLNITDEEASNEDRLRVLRTVNSVKCRDCNGCPESMKEH